MYFYLNSTWILPKHDKIKFSPVGDKRSIQTAPLVQINFQQLSHRFRLDGGGDRYCYRHLVRGKGTNGWPLFFSGTREGAFHCIALGERIPDIDRLFSSCSCGSVLATAQAAVVFDAAAYAPRQSDIDKNNGGCRVRHCEASWSHVLAPSLWATCQTVLRNNDVSS